MDKEQFITARTEIISEMLDNPDEYGIYPTTECFKKLDALFDALIVGGETLPDQRPEQCKGCEYWVRPARGHCMRGSGTDFCIKDEEG